MSCPICGQPMGLMVKFVRGKCWPKIPANDRQQLGAMLRRKQSTESKLESVVRKMKAPK